MDRDVVLPGSVGYSPLGFDPRFFQAPWGGSVPPAVLQLAQSPWSGIDPQTAAFLAMLPQSMPANVAQGNLAATNPFAARSALDPRTAAFLAANMYGGARSPTDNPFTAQQLQQNLGQTFGAGAPSLYQRAEQGFAGSQLALLAALQGAKQKDLVQILGGNKKEAKRLAKSIDVLAKRLKQQPQNPQKIARAVMNAQYQMIPWIANNKAEEKLGRMFFQSFYGVDHPKKAKFNGQGPLGNTVAGMAPGSAAEPNGQFRTGNPSEAGKNALQAAISQIGVREASGNNDGVPSQRYMDGRREPWCANFVSWAFRQAGQPLPGNQRSLASCDYMAGQFKQRGKFMPRGSGQPKAGDVIFFGKPGDYTHVGIVERVANGRVYTVEGNTSDQVARRSYSLSDSYVQGFGIT